MNSKGHLILSIIKSVVRIVSCVLTIVIKSITPMAIGFMIAEGLGICEEMVDKR